MCLPSNINLKTSAEVGGDSNSMRKKLSKESILKIWIAGGRQTPKQDYFYAIGGTR